MSTTIDFLSNFPFPSLRASQTKILTEVSEAFNSGYKHIILEAPTGIGKSPVAVAIALTLGSSYICTSTKDLQGQYSRDFPFIRVAKGKNNFSCLIKEDFIRNGNYTCGYCGGDSGRTKARAGCYHTSAEYGPCKTDKRDVCNYMTNIGDYVVTDKGTKNEQILLDNDAIAEYQNKHLQLLNLKNLKDQKVWRPCQYFDQLSIAYISSHSIFNYSMFLACLLSTRAGLKPRGLLVLDEGHQLEQEIKFAGFSLPKKRWKRYIGNLDIVDYGYDDIEKWIEFLIELETKMLGLVGDTATIRNLAKYRMEKTGRQIKGSGSMGHKAIAGINVNVNVNDDGEEEKAIVSDYKDALKRSMNFSDELASEAAHDLENLTGIIDIILSDPKKWITSDVKKENEQVVKVEFKPLDISKYCKEVFALCKRTLTMSATILNSEAFCRNVGLNPGEVKFIQIESEFPLQNRLIYPLDVAYLNFNNQQLEGVRSAISKKVDNIMTLHRNDKGIIHTTSYEQLNFIRNNISLVNAQRLIETDPEIQRVEVINRHMDSAEPTVLISPSLYTGLDLKDGLSRFQIITKVPYPNQMDRWTNEKRKKDPEWYCWQTALKLVQAYGRSIRSKDDWAKTYILDSGFDSFVEKNADMLPNWFKQAIIKGCRRTTGCHTGNTCRAFDTKLSTATTNNNHNYERDVSDHLKKEKVHNESAADPHNLLDFLGLKEEPGLARQQDKSTTCMYYCYYCRGFQTTSKREYESHGVKKHPGKSLYPGKADLNRLGMHGIGMRWEV
jgi:ATP-dependent DNA helicase DinG